MCKSAAQLARRLDTTRLVVVALLFGFSLISYFDRTIMSIAGPQLMKDFAISPTQMGAVYSAFILGYALLMVPGGHLVGPARRPPHIRAHGSVFCRVHRPHRVHRQPGLGAYLGVCAGTIRHPARVGCRDRPALSGVRENDCKLDSRGLPRACPGIRYRGIIGRRGYFAITVYLDGVAAFDGASPLSSPPAPPRLSRSSGCGMPETTLPRVVARRRAQPNKRYRWIEAVRRSQPDAVDLCVWSARIFSVHLLLLDLLLLWRSTSQSAQASAKYTTLLFLTEGAIMPAGGLLSDHLTADMEHSSDAASSPCSD